MFSLNGNVVSTHLSKCIKNVICAFGLSTTYDFSMVDITSENN